MSSNERTKIALDVLRVILGDDKEALGQVGLQLIQLYAGTRKRLSSGRKKAK
jgi:hypothetical protein